MRATIFVLVGLILSGCVSTDKADHDYETVAVKKSFISGADQVDSAEQLQLPDTDTKKKGFQILTSLSGDSEDVTLAKIADYFQNDTQSVTFAADNLPASEFIHYTFGEVLKVNYVVNADVKNDSTLLTLNIQNPISKQEGVNLVSQLLSRYQINVDYDSETFFFQKSELGKAKAVIGIGRNFESVPNTSGQILQVVPLKYGIKLAVEKTVRNMIEGKIDVDFEQNALFIQANRTNVIRALELVKILDVPSNRGKHIGLMSLTYIPVADFLIDVKQLLESEGILADTSFNKTKNVLLIPLNHIGAIAVFAPDEDLLNRVRYWSTVLDQPTQGENLQYFVYTPKYARAADLGQSVGQLLTLGRPKLANNRNSTGSAAASLATESNSSTTQKTFSAENISFVVDELSNSLVFSASGNDYQKLLPLLNQMDALPKQVLLELMIVEVTLTDDFKYGVEFALRNSSRFTASTLGGFGAGETGGINFQFIGNEGQAVASFFRENRLVNVVSNPTLLVRDGVNASIRVGDSIPIQSGTVVDDGVQTTNIQYRDTGVDVSVTPTVNSQGVIIMSISLDISNTVSTTADSATPSIFQRNLSTEAVVNTGQTVILGGLISENSSNGETKVPVLGDMPLIGSIFKGRNDSATKTELVMLVTPKVLSKDDKWDKLMNDFQNGLENIQIVNQSTVNP